MPFTAQYLVTNPAPNNPFSTPGVTPFISGSFLAGCDAGFDDQIYFLGILEKAYPQAYVEGLRAKPGGGYELFQAAAAVGERLSVAVNRLECCAFVITAEGGAKAEGTVELFRTTGQSLPEFTVKAGSVVRTKYGRDFLVLEDAFFEGFGQGDPPPPGPDALGPKVVRVQAVDVGWEYNVEGQVIAKNGEVLPGEICESKCLIIEPPIFAASSTTIQVRQIVPTQGGKAACLDGLAHDLDIERSLFETDAEFRLRIRETQDTVSCGAIQRGVDKILKARDPSFSSCLREVGRPLLPGIFYDANSSADVGNPARNFAYDMEPENRPEDRWKVYFNTIEMRGFFLVGIPEIDDTRNFGMFYDGSDGDPVPLQNAYDDTAIDNGDTAYDGFPIFDGAFNKTISDMISGKKACGVGFDLYIERGNCV